MSRLLKFTMDRQSGTRLIDWISKFATIEPDQPTIHVEIHTDDPDKEVKTKPVHPLAGKWGWSVDGETYHGCFSTKEEALAEETGKYVGQYVEPSIPDPVDISVIDELLYTIETQDEWCLDCINTDIQATKNQKSQLAEKFNEVFFSWLTEHDLWPKWALIENAEEINK